MIKLLAKVVNAEYVKICVQQLITWKTSIFEYLHSNIETKIRETNAMHYISHDRICSKLTVL